MKVGILAGGMGSRLAEETELKPKPMVEIGGRPILWHIMKHYAQHGFTDFVIAVGYKGEMIKRYMLEYCSLHSDITIGTGDGKVVTHNGPPDDWSVSLIDTGLTTASGGRMKRMAPYLGEGTFMMTLGDGVSTVDINRLLEFHRSHGRLATLTAVRPPARFGHISLEGDRVAVFAEKPKQDEVWINGAFFVLEPGVLDYIEGDETSWEYGPLDELARDGQLMAFRHDGFWECMDTIRDRRLLEQLWQSGRAPWKTWE